MTSRIVKSLLIVTFSLFALFFSPNLLANETPVPPAEHSETATTEHPKKEGFNAAEVIFGHILDNHEFHITGYQGADGEEHHLSIPLPIIIYSSQNGVSCFMSSKFGPHGHEEYKGYQLHEGTIVATDGSKLYDLSLTRNVVQMLLALGLLCWIMISIANAYKKGLGVTSAPKGKQNLFEPVIAFVRDEVAKPYLGHKYEKYLPYLLTTFFFILINNVIGLIPGTANVTGNIAFTVVLGLISFVVIMFSTNKHYWAHIFNPPGVPMFVKFILVPVEVLGIFIKPIALILRLFANMVAGHIIIICLISLIFIFGQMNAGAGWGASPLSIAFTIFIYFIEVLVAFLQAFIFTNLTAVFIGQAMEEPEHHVEPHAH